jgi:hypothetical protein
VPRGHFIQVVLGELVQEDEDFVLVSPLGERGESGEITWNSVEEDKVRPVAVVAVYGTGQEDRRVFQVADDSRAQGQRCANTSKTPELYAQCVQLSAFFFPDGRKGSQGVIFGFEPISELALEDIVRFSRMLYLTLVCLPQEVVRLYGFYVSGQGFLVGFLGLRGHPPRLFFQRVDRFV